MNIAALLSGAGAVTKSVASHPITKGGSLAALITGGLAIASAVGVAVPEIAFTVGPIAGYVLYKILPKKFQDQLDGVVEEVVDIDAKIPEIHTYAEYPGDDKKMPPAQSNINGGNDGNPQI